MVDDDAAAGAVRVSFQDPYWVVDYGGGFSRPFASREDAIAIARDASEIEGRDLEIIE